ncbi:hypothetical protein PHLCEN_2v13693 [Hermanssonia centrifuga]|uniref:Uncharacterized protein n=1 Tax=Hermanssonia centrifuga TaxID=98765 RepID=A0A2R6NEH4_9APHY|nr:hypothetical protein PHLCEN_2v13693 [Hermanssonia centrifuga]
MDGHGKRYTINLFTSIVPVTDQPLQFPIGMGTGAVYVTLSGLKSHAPALTTVETIFYFINICLFLLNTTTLLLQAILYPRQAWRLLKDPVKGIFVPLVVLSFATIIIGTINYAVPSGHVHPDFIYVIFWIMMTGFLEGHQANGAFVACGPPGFTALALINLGKQAQEILPLHGLVSPAAGEIWYASSVMAGLLLFGLAVFFFIFGALPYWFKVHKHLHEILGFGWISTIRVLGDIFDLQGFFVWHLIMSILMCTVWVVLFALTAVAFWKGKIFLAKDEDVLKDSVKQKELNEKESYRHSNA